MTVRSRTGVCPSGKTWFRNRRACWWGIERTRHRVPATTFGALPVPTLWAYDCPECSGWHMTSRDPATRPPIDERRTT